MRTTRHTRYSQITVDQVEVEGVKRPKQQCRRPRAQMRQALLVALHSMSSRHRPHERAAEQQRSRWDSRSRSRSRSRSPVHHRQQHSSSSSTQDRHRRPGATRSGAPERQHDQQQQHACDRWAVLCVRRMLLLRNPACIVSACAPAADGTTLTARECRLLLLLGRGVHAAAGTRTGS
jgi:hypothetical protein